MQKDFLYVFLFLFYPLRNKENKTSCTGTRYHSGSVTDTNTIRVYCKMAQFHITLHPTNKHLIYESWLLLHEC